MTSLEIWGIGARGRRGLVGGRAEYGVQCRRWMRVRESGRRGLDAEGERGRSQSRRGARGREWPSRCGVAGVMVTLADGRTGETEARSAGWASWAGLGDEDGINDDANNGHSDAACRGPVLR